MAPLSIEGLGLTPSQIAEVGELDKALVGMWLEALGEQSGLRSPAGWFLSGVRSGNPPGVLSDARKAQAVHLAERFLVNAGWGLPTEAELLDELFGRHGKLRAWASDEQLRARMVSLWRELRRPPAIVWPRG